jgi:crotonobetainyl-CoA:carnitine CoA-transferase CaiB-like acyl-CoA transferase
MEPGLLAIAGADVVNVEPPGGDRRRRRPHELAYYNGGKKSVVLDLGSPDVIESLRRFAAGVDIVFIAPNRRSPVAGWEPDARRSAGRLRRRSAAASRPSVTAFPATLRTSHAVSFAPRCEMHEIGPESRPPRAIPANPLYDELSAHAAVAALVALRERPAVGGQAIELALHDLLACRHSFHFAAYGLTGRPSQIRKAAAPPPPPTGAWETRDGRVDLLVYNPAHWDGFIELLCRPPGLEDASLRDRGTHGDRAAQPACVLDR